MKRHLLSGDKGDVIEGNVPLRKGTQDADSTVQNRQENWRERQVWPLRSNEKGMHDDGIKLHKERPEQVESKGTVSTEESIDADPFFRSEINVANNVQRHHVRG